MLPRAVSVDPAEALKLGEPIFRQTDSPPAPLEAPILTCPDWALWGPALTGTEERRRVELVIYLRPRVVRLGEDELMERVS